MTEALKAGGPRASDENKAERLIKFTEVSRKSWICHSIEIADSTKINGLHVGQL